MNTEMNDLTSKVCTPCQGGVSTLTPEEASEYISQTTGWELIDDDHKINKKFKFSNFRETFDFVKKVGELAESEGHHPVITFGWGFCSIDLQSKKIKGLHENDFIMAAKINKYSDNN
jgi:4a-hydroxytetrahydrobiopterin dehydratase